MSTLTKTELSNLKNALLEQRENLQRHFASSMEDGAPAESLKDSTGELSSYDNHPGDAGTETFERSRDLAVDETLADEFDQINAALERMHDGTYGTCIICGKDIPYERLEAIPYTAYCIDDTPSRELSSDRPVEENVMTLPPRGAGQARQRHAGKFDHADAWEAVSEYGTSDSETTVPGRGSANREENL